MLFKIRYKIRYLRSIQEFPPVKHLGNSLPFQHQEEIEPTAFIGFICTFFLTGFLFAAWIAFALLRAFDYPMAPVPPGMSGTDQMVIVIVFIGLPLFLFIRSIFYFLKIEVDQNLVSYQLKTLFRKRIWQEPLKNYGGVRITKPHTNPQALYSVLLQHKNDPKKNIKLCRLDVIFRGQYPDDLVPNKKSRNIFHLLALREAKHFAKILNLPFLEELPDDRQFQRQEQDLQKPVYKLLQEGIIPLSQSSDETTLASKFLQFSRAGGEEVFTLKRGARKDFYRTILFLTLFTSLGVLLLDLSHYFAQREMLIWGLAGSLLIFLFGSILCISLISGMYYILLKQTLRISDEALVCERRLDCGR